MTRRAVDDGPEPTLLPVVPLETPAPHVWAGIERRALSVQGSRRRRRLVSRALQVAAGLVGFLSVSALAGLREPAEARDTNALLTEATRPLRHADALSAAPENLLLAHFDSHEDDAR